MKSAMGMMRSMVVSQMNQRMRDQKKAQELRFYEANGMRLTAEQEKKLAYLKAQGY